MPWLPIEIAPRDGTIIDLWISGPMNPGSRIADCWFERGRWVHEYGRDGPVLAAAYVSDVPTHWMPTPDGPE